MQCETCDQPLTKIHNQQYHHCTDCNSYHFPTDMADSVDPIRALGKEVEGECPKCVYPLKLGLIHDRWNVCYCEPCRGFLIESGCLQVAAHELRASYQGQDDTPVPIDPRELDCQRACPACLTRFDTHAYFGFGNIVIDNCHACGLTWLDHGELATIIRAPGKRPSPDSSAIAKPYVHIPTDPVAESICATTKFVIKSALRFAIAQ